MIKFFTENTSPRLEYAVDLLLNQVAGISYTMVTSEELISEGDIVINYSGKKLQVSNFQIHPCGLLMEKDINTNDVSFEYRQDGFLISVFPAEFDDLGFDVFAASFYIVSRYEEYRKFNADEHGRFTSDQSFQSKVGILKRPIVNIWVHELIRMLNSKWKTEIKIKGEFKIVNSIDVDVAFAYLAKGTIRATGGISKDLIKGSFSDVKKRWDIISKKKKDPFYTYDYISEVSQENRVETIYFLLLGDYKKPYDTASDFNSPDYKDLVSQLRSYAKIGIHPSYNSYLNESKLKQETSRLKEFLSSDETIISRKHFLRLSVPDCYRLMENVGIKEDYTMGYADNVGFRAGLCTPFKIFDLLQNRQLEVTIHPFAYMDGTLREYLKLNLEEAKNQLTFLNNQVKAVNGEFIGIWHNTSLTNEDEWKGWREVYEASFK
ncbi:MAG: polysaccharide deacetylase family protein [Flavobacteriales bacterium]|nr:polysaccharide deacetylase family protein [Flavobacteriales bacterium]